MGSCCTYSRPKKAKCEEIINVSEKNKIVPEKKKIVVITPREKREVPHLKKLQSNPLYRRRRRKSLTDVKETQKINQNLKKRATIDSNFDQIRNKLILGSIPPKPIPIAREKSIKKDVV